jgi:hypothetical protein
LEAEEDDDACDGDAARPGSGEHEIVLEYVRYFRARSCQFSVELTLDQRPT